MLHATLDASTTGLLVLFIAYDLVVLSFVGWVLLGSPRNRNEWHHRWSVIRNLFVKR